MFVGKKVRYSALFINLVGWHNGAVSFPPSDIILAQLAFPLSDIMFCFHFGRTNISLYKHCQSVAETKCPNSACLIVVVVSCRQKYVSFDILFQFSQYLLQIGALLLDLFAQANSIHNAAGRFVVACCEVCEAEGTKRVPKVHRC